jgi:hypothetical protein
MRILGLSARKEAARASSSLVATIVAAVRAPAALLIVPEEIAIETESETIVSIALSESPLAT